MENKSLSQRIADFVLGLKYEDIPKEVIDHAKMLMIDTVSYTHLDVYKRQALLSNNAVFQNYDFIRTCNCPHSMSDDNNSFIFNKAGKRRLYSRFVFHI